MKNVADVEDAFCWRSRGRKRLHHPHTKDGSKLVARGEIHAHITCTDVESNNTVQMDDLAYSLAQLHLGPATPSIALHETNSRRWRSSYGRPSKSSGGGGYK